jgi:1-phosphatidylinositol-4-phosphate 5-kinase
MLYSYYEHLKKNTNTLIIKFYGLHAVQWTEGRRKKHIYLVIMGNIIGDFKTSIKYDLKGSTTGRTALKPGETPETYGEKAPLKCNDFRTHQKQIVFRSEQEHLKEQNDHLTESSIIQTDDEDLEPQKMENLVDILCKDAQFLAENNIIDYSVLIGEIHEDPYELSQRLLETPSLKQQAKGVFFATDGKPYFVGIIDPLTGFNL